MPTINQLPAASSLSSRDQVPVYDARNGDARKASLSLLQSWLDRHYVPLIDAAVTKAGLVFVDSVDDLPNAISGVRTLADNTAYFFTTNIDLLGDRLVCGENTVLLGTSSESSRIKSTGLTGTALITSAYSLPMRFIAIEADVGVAIDGADPTTAALDWIGVNFVDTPTVGTIENVSNFIMTDSAFLNSAGLTFDGTIGTIGFQTCLLDGRPSSTTITVAATATITRRFRAVQSSFVALSGETAIDFSASATCPVEGYILGTVNFSGGGTYTAGVQYDDNKAQFFNVRGVPNSSSVCGYFMTGNATATVNPGVGVFEKAAGTTSAGAYVQRFTLSANRATYTGALSGYFKVSAVATISAQNNRQIAMRVAVDGTTIASSQMATNSEGVLRSAPLTSQSIVFLQTGQFVEVWVANVTDGTNVTVEDLNVTVEPLVG